LEGEKREREGKIKERKKKKERKKRKNGEMVGDQTPNQTAKPLKKGKKKKKITSSGRVELQS
jgi:hypothetical protein